MIFCIFLLKNADYSYVKAQSAIMTHAELGGAIICSCLFVLPRLYRHIAAIPPYGSEAYTTRQRSKASADASALEHGYALSDHDDSAPRRSLVGKKEGGRRWTGGFQRRGVKFGQQGRKGEDRSRKEWERDFEGLPRERRSREGVTWKHASLDPVRPPTVPSKDSSLQEGTWMELESKG